MFGTHRCGSKEAQLNRSVYTIGALEFGRGKAACGSGFLDNKSLIEYGPDWLAAMQTG